MTFDVVFLARHGQTEWNQEGRKQGRLDSPLTAVGRTHAVDLARLVGSLDVDLIASSPIGRALTTAQTCASALGLTVQIFDELAEIHHGEMGGLTTPEANVRFPGALGQRALDKYNWRFPGGESYADADVRASVALGRIVKTGAQRPLIVSHEMIGRMLLRNLLGCPPGEVLTGQQPHHLVYQVDPSLSQVAEIVTQAV